MSNMSLVTFAGRSEDTIYQHSSELPLLLLVEKSRRERPETRRSKRT